MTAALVQEHLAALHDSARAAHLQGFFKTGKGEYGEGDRFRGIRVPKLRRIASRFQALPLEETLRLLQSAFHEDRFVALAILVLAFQRGNQAKKKEVFGAYLRCTPWINSWDLVDASAHKIVGPYLTSRERSALYVLAKSTSIWERRIAIVATLHFIKDGEYVDTLAISEVLLQDSEPLIHKAVGWMLREVGKCNLRVEEDFLRIHYRSMPRTMLRYAIERFKEARRQAYLTGTV